DRAEELIDIGAQIQINAGCLLGESGYPVRQYCRSLLEEGFVRYIASDAHNMEDRRPNLARCAEWLEKKYGYEYTKKLLIDNPEEIVRSGRKR
ncbi:MAG: hypothetical protein LUF30_01850, partial [Lachnospiraceae bacterium]|nr:hypothetical protein [Lachnospiraceae bacterium]